MYKIQLKDIHNHLVTIYFTHSLTVYKTEDGNTHIVDGNNGEWIIPKDYYTHKQILEIIDDVISGVDYKWRNWEKYE